MLETVTNRLFDILVGGIASAALITFAMTSNDVMQTVIDVENGAKETEFAVRCATNLEGSIRCRLADDQAAIKTVGPSDSDLAAQVVDAATHNPAPERKPHA
tara:strand:+ start:553 stop:858 length:306 start_codon:yes stop_codon:yes gene_type:complete